MTTSSTEPISVTRTALGTALSGPCGISATSDPGAEGAGTSRFTLVLMTREQVETFLGDLRHPDHSDDFGNYETWGCGFLAVDDAALIEAQMGVFLVLDWPETAPTTITCSVHVLLWADYGTRPTVRIQLDAVGARSLHDAVTACVDERLPRRPEIPNRSAGGNTDDDPWAIDSDLEVVPL